MYIFYGFWTIIQQVKFVNAAYPIQKGRDLTPLGVLFGFPPAPNRFLFPVRSPGEETIGRKQIQIEAAPSVTRFTGGRGGFG